MKLRLDITATEGAARTGVVATARGSYRTPLFMPVGTRGTLRAATTLDLARLGAEFMLSNNYHLMLRPGAERVAELGGLHRFAGWDGHMLTDSGGYQVFSLEPKVTEEGARFQSVYDGSWHELTPEGAVATQELIGADIQMVLDICSPLPSPRERIEADTARTLRWAERARRAHRRTADQALFGIVQGGVLSDLRVESARNTAQLEFDGYGIGGLSVGEPRSEMLPALAAALSELPVDQPRYLMGVGDPASIVEAVALGVDMFDCVLPTRLGRHGTLLTDSGRLNIKRAEFASSEDPIDSNCPCEVCRTYSRGYLRHLMVVGEPAGATLATLHNLAWLLRLVDRTRETIETGTFASLREQILAVYD